MNYKVIYILSVGHSGSTLLDIMLGQFNNTFSTGELEQFTWQLYREINGIENAEGKCTCNRKFLECPVWSKIINVMKNEKNIDLDSLPHEIKIKYLESLNYFDNPVFYRVVRKIYNYSLKNKIIPASFFSLYLREITKSNIFLFQSIYKVVEKEHLIDSSKNIIRFNELHKKMRENIFPLILIRNINKIVDSKYINASKRNSWIKSWFEYYNYRILPMIKNMHDNNFHIISYEAFIDDPIKVIGDLSKKINVNPNEFSEDISMENMHLCAGNPMRYSNDIKIRKQKLNKDVYIDDLRKSGLDNFYINYLINQNSE